MAGQNNKKKKSCFRRITDMFGRSRWTFWGFAGAVTPPQNHKVEEEEKEKRRRKINRPREERERNLAP